MKLNIKYNGCTEWGESAVSDLFACYESMERNVARKQKRTHNELTVLAVIRCKCVFHLLLVCAVIRNRHTENDRRFWRNASENWPSLIPYLFEWQSQIGAYTNILIGKWMPMALPNETIAKIFAITTSTFCIHRHLVGIIRRCCRVDCLRVCVCVAFRCQVELRMKKKKINEGRASCIRFIYVYSSCSSSTYMCWLPRKYARCQWLGSIYAIQHAISQRCGIISAK